MTANDLINFENRIRAHWQAGNLPCLLHLCGGNESDLIRVFSEYEPGDWVLSGHRNHYHALLAGVPADELEGAILAGDSMFIFSRDHNFLSSAILAGLCGVANGIAWAIRERGTPEHVWCFVGDGAEEEGHFYEAALFAETHDLPVAFVIEDNDRQVDTPKAERCPGNRPTLDQIFSHVTRYHYTPTYPHAGDGSAPGTITFKPDAIERLSQGCDARHPKV
jgi:TPP-dependent pyruvate/acetoin dehydrogenase alpha subunit